MQRAITEARAQHRHLGASQLLYDLHPLARFWMTKLEARIEKGAGPGRKGAASCPPGERSFVFHGQVTNKLGRNVLSDFFVVTSERRRQSSAASPSRSNASWKTTGLPMSSICRHHRRTELGNLQDDLPAGHRLRREMYMRGGRTNCDAEMAATAGEVLSRTLDRWFKAGRELALPSDGAFLAAGTTFHPDETEPLRTEI